MSRIIDYVDTYCDFDALINRTGKVALLKEFLGAEEKMLELGMQMRKLDRDLNQDLERRGIEPATPEAYKSGPFMKYREQRYRIEASMKKLVSETIPGLKAQLDAYK